MSDKDGNWDGEFLPSYLDDQDVKQELELLKLLGIPRPNRRLVILKMISSAPELHFGEGIEFSNQEISDPWAIPSPNPDAIETLLAISEEIPALADDIFTFLSDPTDDNFSLCLRTARKIGLVRDDRGKGVALQNRPVSLGDMIVAMLERSGPASRLDIIETLAPAHIAKRPAAAIRTSLRRLVGQGHVLYQHDLYTLNPAYQPGE
jgi:hypothetical protein